MASIKKRKRKNGEISYFIQSYAGKDATGKELRQYKTIRIPAGTPERKAYQIAMAEAQKFDQQVASGCAYSESVTLKEFGNDLLKKRSEGPRGVKHNTTRYQFYLWERIEQSLGYKELRKISPRDIEKFETELENPGIRNDKAYAVKRIDVSELLKERKISRNTCAVLASVSPSTVTNACRGDNIAVSSAEKISSVLNIPTDTLFDIHRNMETLSDKTLLEYHRLLTLIFHEAVREKIIERSPMEGMSAPKQRAKKQPRYFEPEQVHAILKALESEPLKWRTMIYLFIGTGARRGEILGLHWEDLDLEHRTLIVKRNLCYSPERGLYETTTKTDRERILALPAENCDLLKRWKEQQQKEASILSERWHTSPYIFTQQEGGPINPTTVTSWLTHFSERHKLPAINPHAFRHTAASLLIAQGFDLATVAAQLGHSNLSTTAEIYTHAIAVARARASSAITASFFGDSEEGGQN